MRIAADNGVALMSLEYSDDRVNLLNNTPTTVSKKALEHATLNYNALQSAINLGLTPFTGSLCNAEDLPSTLEWFLEHDVVTQVHLYNELSPSLPNHLHGNSLQTTLRVAQQQGIPFSTKYLPMFKNLASPTYIRICSLMGEVDNIRDLVRDRDKREGLVYLARQLDGAEWSTFCEQIKTSDRTFGGILDQYDAITKARGRKAANTLNGSRFIAQAYEAVVGTDAQDIFDDLLTIGNHHSLTDEIIAHTAQYLIDGHNRLARLVVDQVHLGIPRDRLESLVDLYSSDEELEELPPQNIIELMQEKKIEIREW
jgi:hypothetical protein